MKKFAIPALIAAAALASCTTERDRPLPDAPATPVSIDGNWSDPNGLVSTFQAGNFNTRTTDTNQLLASGTYVKLPGNNLYEISMVSHVQNKQSKVNCAMISPAQLNCTADSGAQFSLARKSNLVATQ
ncbi:MAG: outer rane lipoprotein [Rhizobium sp.]|nr:outer rane lipoprotein [Rhizobium sp.]